MLDDDSIYSGSDDTTTAVLYAFWMLEYSLGFDSEVYLRQAIAIEF